MEGADLDELLNLLNQNCSGLTTAPSTTGLPASHDLTELRNKGTHTGGHEHIVTMNRSNDPTDTAFDVAINNSTGMADRTDTDGNTFEESALPSKKDLVSILLTKTT